MGRQGPKFIQLYRENGVAALAEMIKQQPVAARVFLYLADKMNHSNAFLSSSREIATDMDLGEATISRAMQFLSKHDYIHRVRKGSAFLIILDPDIIWASKMSWRKQGVEKYGRHMEIENVKVVITKEEMLEYESEHIPQVTLEALIKKVDSVPRVCNSFFTVSNY